MRLRKAERDERVKLAPKRALCLARVRRLGRLRLAAQLRRRLRLGAAHRPRHMLCDRLVHPPLVGEHLLVRRSDVCRGCRRPTDLTQPRDHIARCPRVKLRGGVPGRLRRLEAVLAVEYLQARGHPFDADVRHALEDAPLVGDWPSIRVDLIVQRSVGTRLGRSSLKEVGGDVGGAVCVVRPDEDRTDGGAMLVLQQGEAPLEKKVVDGRGGGEGRHATEGVPRDHGHDDA